MLKGDNLSVAFTLYIESVFLVDMLVNIPHTCCENVDAAPRSSTRIVRVIICIHLRVLTPECCRMLHREKSTSVRTVTESYEGPVGRPSLVHQNNLRGFCQDTIQRDKQLPTSEVASHHLEARQQESTSQYFTKLDDMKIDEISVFQGNVVQLTSHSVASDLFTSEKNTSITELLPTIVVMRLMNTNQKA